MASQARIIPAAEPQSDKKTVIAALADEILHNYSKGRVIVAVDEPIAATRCKPGSAKGCTAQGARCVTHDLWEELGRQIHVFLSSVTLADVVEKRILGRTKPCELKQDEKADATAQAA